MDRPVYEVQKAESLAVRRTIQIPMYASADYVTPGTVVLGKAALKLNNGTSAASTNSMSADAAHPGVAFLELTAAELSAYGTISVTAAMGSSFGQAVVVVTRFDPFTEGAKTEQALRFDAGVK